MTRARISRNKIKAAIPDSGGLIARVASKSGYSWASVRDVVRDDPELAAMMDAEEERVNDAAENTVISKIMAGDENSAKWWLARRRRVKFGDNVDLTSGGKAINWKSFIESENDDPSTDSE